MRAYGTSHVRTARDVGGITFPVQLADGAVPGHLAGRFARRCLNQLTRSNYRRGLYGILLEVSLRAAWLYFRVQVRVLGHTVQSTYIKL